MNVPPLIRLLARFALATLGAALLLALHPRFSGVASGVDLVTEPGRAGEVSAHADLPFHLSTLRGVFPVGRIVSVAEYYVGMRNGAALREQLRDRSFAAAPPPGHEEREVYVLAIGESSRADRWQLSGYGRGTNPILGNVPGVVWMQDVVTPWTYTLASVPVIATPKSAGDSSLFLTEKSLLSLFREAGFRTYWISNQARSGNAATPVGQIASEANEIRWTNATNAVDDSAETTHDDALLAPVNEVLGRAERRQFIVLHLMGSHDAYQRRYPISFNHFRPSLTDRPGANAHSPDNRELINNAYDNSVRYTDHVLGRITTVLRNTGAISALYYVSDHGESLFDGTCPLIGHGGTARLNYQVSAFAWLSPRYMQEFPQVMPALRNNSAKRASTENTFESMADLAHIDYPAADRTRSVFSPAFRERSRMVHVNQSVIDWDKARFTGRCEEPATAE